jgi:hypothetical protein
MRLINKKILLFAPNFFGYDVEIKSRLEELGAKVDLYDERPSSNFFVKAAIRIKKELLLSLTEKYFDKILKSNAVKNYDYVFIVKGEVINSKIIRKYKSVFSKAKFVLYLFDSIENYKSIITCLNYFDVVMSFDRSDADKYPDIKFRPLFYVHDFESIDHPDDILNYKYDILFVGTIHSDRWAYLERVKKESIRLGLRVCYYLYVQSIFIFIFKKIFVKGFKTLRSKDVHFKPIDKKKLIELTRKSKSVLDIQHPKQSGLTMRTIEVLGAGRKLITTNKDIVLYDFYSPDNISVIERGNPQISLEFINSPFKLVDRELLFKYSLTGWIYDVLDLNEKS